MTPARRDPDAPKLRAFYWSKAAAKVGATKHAVSPGGVLAAPAIQPGCMEQLHPWYRTSGVCMLTLTRLLCLLWLQPGTLWSDIAPVGDLPQPFGSALNRLFEVRGCCVSRPAVMPAVPAVRSASLHACLPAYLLKGDCPSPDCLLLQLRDSRPATPASQVGGARRGRSAAVVKVIPLPRANNVSIMLTQVGRAVQCSAVQGRAGQGSAVQCSAVQCSAVQY